MVDQLVLVTDAALVRQLGAFQGYTVEVETYLSAIFEAGNSRFVARAPAERDPQLKQLIPYVILRFGSSVFTYVRGKQSGETRLVALRSIGVGGHIELMDGQPDLFSPDHTFYESAAQREVEEEVVLTTEYESRIVALINDDSNDVGSVHLGIVHIWDLASPAVKKREGAITQAGFVEISELRRHSDELETWSQIALNILKDPKIPKYQPTFSRV
jgi:predicted NUDIX family phosphoesterase